MIQENEEKARNQSFRAFKVNSVSRPDVQCLSYFKLRRLSRPDVKADPNNLSLVQQRFLYVPALFSWACLLLRCMPHRRSSPVPPKKAQRLYRQTGEGKKSHSLSENRRRHRKIVPRKKNMDDHTSTSPMKRVILPPRVEISVHFRPGFRCRCHFCGRPGEIVSRFPRRSYG